MSKPAPDLVVIHEHPEWQKPLFAALERRGVAFEAFNVATTAFANHEVPKARLYFNQASPAHMCAATPGLCRWRWPTCARSSATARAS